jgi:EAL domain-containing protein (putative c-di-GMP-specific phosphodiesterase class I)
MVTRIGHPQSGPPHRPVPSAEGGRGTRVLVLDDEQGILNFVSLALRTAGFEVWTTSEPAAFFEHQRTKEPHVVVVDLAMPALDGIAILRGLRDASFGGEILLISGSDQHVLETARRIGMGYGLRILGQLHKPFRASQLVSLLTPATERSAIADGEVSRALEQGEIVPFFQPKYDLRSGRLVGAEALARWTHPQRGVLTPAHYLPIVNRAGKQSAHDLMILEKTAAACERVTRAFRKLHFAVNFSVETIMSEDLGARLKAIGERFSLTMDQIVIELTETETTTSFGPLAERLMSLRLQGVGIAIDDFGVGHSSLHRIQKLPISEIKIDRSFIEGLTEYSDDVAIVRAIIDLTHALRLKAAAEGVETRAAYDVVKKLGCDYAQGYLFSPAVSEEAFLSIVKSDETALSAQRA